MRTAALLDLSRLTAEEARTGQREITVDPSGRIVGLHTAFDQRTLALPPVLPLLLALVSVTTQNTTTL